MTPALDLVRHALDTFAPNWSASLVALNLTIFANLVGALVLGMVVGYERTFHGRAAGMRTFGMVSMASCSIVILAGCPDGWFGGGRMPGIAALDGTRLIQGLVTGVGFLGAGLIHRDGHKTSGLTTAAAVWASCAIGILVGLGLYAAAMLMAVLCMLCMAGGSRIERLLPARQGYAITLGARPHDPLSQQSIVDAVAVHGYSVDPDSFEIELDERGQRWRFLAHARRGRRPSDLPTVAAALAAIPGVARYQIASARG